MSVLEQVLLCTSVFSSGLALGLVLQLRSSWEAQERRVNEAMAAGFVAMQRDLEALEQTVGECDDRIDGIARGMKARLLSQGVAMAGRES